MRSPPGTRTPRLPSAEPSELRRVPLQRGAAPWRARWRHSCRGGTVAVGPVPAVLPVGKAPGTW